MATHQSTARVPVYATNGTIAAYVTPRDTHMLRAGSSAVPIYNARGDVTAYCSIRVKENGASKIAGFPVELSAKHGLWGWVPVRSNSNGDNEG